MSREQERIKRKLEKNPIVECNKIQQKYCPALFQAFAEAADPRHQSYTDYTGRVMRELSIIRELPDLKVCIQ